MRGKVDRTQVAYGNFGFVGVERDFGAKIRAVHHTDVLLRRTDIAGILEGDPGVAGFEQHGQHFAPERNGGNLLEQGKGTEEGRGGKGWVSTGRSRWAQKPEKQ